MTQLLTCLTVMVVAMATTTHCSVLDDILGGHDLDILLRELTLRKRQEVAVHDRVRDIVDMVYSYTDTDDVIDARQTNQIKTCKDGSIASCKDNSCDETHTRRCRPICDAYDLGPNKERYSCRCMPEASGVFCNVTDTVEQLCKDNCRSSRCYGTKSSKGGYFCFDNDWKVVNSDDIVGRSIEGIQEMGHFAEVVERIVRRRQDREN